MIRDPAAALAFFRLGISVCITGGFNKGFLCQNLNRGGETVIDGHIQTCSAFPGITHLVTTNDSSSKLTPDRSPAEPVLAVEHY